MIICWQHLHSLRHKLYEKNVPNKAIIIVIAEEITCLHQLISIHRTCPGLWVSLGEAYLTLGTSRHNGPGSRGAAASQNHEHRCFSSLARAPKEDIAEQNKQCISGITTDVCQGLESETNSSSHQTEEGVKHGSCSCILGDVEARLAVLTCYSRARCVPNIHVTSWSHDGWFAG